MKFHQQIQDCSWEGQQKKADEFYFAIARRVEEQVKKNIEKEKLRRAKNILLTLSMGTVALASSAYLILA